MQPSGSKGQAQAPRGLALGPDVPGVHILGPRHPIILWSSRSAIGILLSKTVLMPIALGAQPRFLHSRPPRLLAGAHACLTNEQEGQSHSRKRDDVLTVKAKASRMLSREPRNKRNTDKQVEHRPSQSAQHDRGLGPQRKCFTAVGTATCKNGSHKPEGGAGSRGRCSEPWPSKTTRSGRCCVWALSQAGGFFFFFIKTLFLI